MEVPWKCWGSLGLLLFIVMLNRETVAYDCEIQQYHLTNTTVHVTLNDSPKIVVNPSNTSRDDVSNHSDVNTMTCFWGCCDHVLPDGDPCCPFPLSMTVGLGVFGGLTLVLALVLLSGWWLTSRRRRRSLRARGQSSPFLGHPSRRRETAAGPRPRSRRTPIFRPLPPFRPHLHPFRSPPPPQDSIPLREFVPRSFPPLPPTPGMADAGRVDSAAAAAARVKPLNNVPPSASLSPPPPANGSARAATTTTFRGNDLTAKSSDVTSAASSLAYPPFYRNIAPPPVPAPATPTAPPCGPATQALCKKVTDLLDNLNDTSSAVALLAAKHNGGCGGGGGGGGDVSDPWERKGVSEGERAEEPHSATRMLRTDPEGKIAFRRN